MIGKNPFSPQQPGPGPETQNNPAAENFAAPPAGQVGTPPGEAPQGEPGEGFYAGGAAETPPLPQMPPYYYEPGYDAGQEAPFYNQPTAEFPPYQPPYPYSGWQYPEAAAPPPRRRKRVRATEVALLAVSLAIVVLLALLLGVLATAAGTVSQLLRPSSQNAYPPAGSFSVIRIQGEIANRGSDALGVNDPSYHHADTLAYIRALAQNEGDKGILLYMDTPGGGVYESDEIYRALMDYREETGRPVWAYMGQVCASGGYYICMAAENLAANYNTTTGSIGVYIALTDISGLYNKLGIETVLVRSGENKGVGTPGVPITQEQREVYQSSVDESFNRFVDLIEEGRGMSRSEVLKLADGRTYTATQALENGLVDETAEWETVLEAFEAETEAKAYYPSFSRQTYLGSLLSGVLGQLPKGEAEAILSRTEALPQGVPLAYAYELA